MPERFDLTYEMTRADWLAVSEACMRESPAWDDAKARYRRTMRKQALWLSPLVIAGAAVLVGRDQGTGEMYLAGAGLGACFAAFLFFALPRLDTIEKAKKAQLAQLQRADRPLSRRSTRGGAIARRFLDLKSLGRSAGPYSSPRVCTLKTRAASTPPAIGPTM